MPESPPTILLLDDEQTFTQLLQEHLEIEGYKTYSFERKSDGLQWLMDHPADLVVTDMNAPGMSGLDFLARLRISPKTRNTKAIVLSGNISSRVAKKAMRLGALAVFTKPFDLSEFLSVVDRFSKQEYSFDISASKAAARGGVILPGKGTGLNFILDREQASTENPYSRTTEPDGASGFIAVLDDCPGYRMTFTMMLQNQGYDVVAHEDKRAFLDLIPVFEPSLIITDLQCPGMDGLEFIRELKARWGYLKIPVIVVTAYVHEGHYSVQASMAEGIFGMIDKPPIKEELITMVRKALSTPR